MSQEARAFSDDESSRSEHSAQPLSRSLSFPLEVSFDELQEIAAQVENESQSQALAESLRQSLPAADDEDSDQDQGTLQRRRWEQEIAAAEPRNKQRRILTRARAARVTHLSDLINSGLLEVGDTITLKGHRGVINREGWIEYGDNMYPGAWTWCNAIKANQEDVSLAVPLDDSLNTQNEEQLGWDSTIIESRDAPLNEYRELYEKESEFRQRLHNHKSKLLERRRRAQRQRENAHRGLPPSQEDDENDPALYRSRLDSQSLDEAIEEDDLEDYEPISPSKQKKRKRKRSKSPSTRSPQKKRKRPQLPEKDFSEWTSVVRSRGSGSSPKATTSPVPSPSPAPAPTPAPAVVHMEPPPRVVQMEPLDVDAETDDFFSLPNDESQLVPGASDSLNSVVGNLIHLADETQSQLTEQELLPDSQAGFDDVVMEDVRPPPAGPNRIVPEDDDLPAPVAIIQPESQEWIQRRRSHSASPRKPTTPTEPVRSRTAPIEISDSLEPISLSDSMDVEMANVEEPAPPPSPVAQSPERVPSPVPSPSPPAPSSTPRTQTASPSPAPPASSSTPPSSSSSSGKSTTTSSASSSQHTESPQSSQKSQSSPSQPGTAPASQEDEDEQEDSSAMRSTSSAPELEREKVYEEEEVFLVPSQPAPRTKSPPRQPVVRLSEPPLTSLADQWNKRKQQKREQQRAAQQAEEQRASEQQAEEQRMQDVDLEEMEDLAPLNEDPPTSQTVPYVSQGVQASPSSQGTAAQFKTLAEQWEERKRNSQEKEPEPEPLMTVSPPPSSPAAVQEELRQLEELEASQARQEAERKRIESRQQVKAALAEQQRLEQAAKEKAELEAKVQREREEQRKKLALRQEKERQKQAEEQRRQEAAKQQAETLRREQEARVRAAEEEKRQQEQRRVAERQRQEQEQLRLAEQQRQEEQRQAEERKRKAAEQRQLAEQLRLEETKREADALRQRQAEEARARAAAEEKRQQEQLRLAELQRQEEQRKAEEEQRLVLQQQEIARRRKQEEEAAERQRKELLEERKRQQREAARVAELQAQEAKRQEEQRLAEEEKQRKLAAQQLKKQKEEERRRVAEAQATPTRSPGPIEDIDAVVAYCHRKQQEIEQPELARTRTTSSSSLEQQMQERRQQRRQEDKAERSQRESELSQKLDDILSSCDSMEVDEESVGSVESQRATRPAKTEAAASSSSRSSWYPPAQSQRSQQERERSESILSIESDHVSESPLVEMSQEEQIPVTEASTSRPIILASGLSSIMLQRIHILVQELGGILVHQWSSQVTHLVVLTTGFHSHETRRTLKYAQAVLSGIWVVNYDWILESFHRRTWVNELVYQIQGDSTCADNIPQRARHARAKGKKALFSGYRFYFCGKFEGIEKDSLKSLITTGGGRIHSTLPRVPKTTREELEAAHNTQHWIVVCDGTAFDYEAAKTVYFSSGVQPISFEYLFDSISHYELLPTARYQILQTSTETFQSQCSQAF